jgi:hypothetical protein
MMGRKAMRETMHLLRRGRGRVEVEAAVAVAVGGGLTLGGGSSSGRAPQVSEASVETTGPKGAGREPSKPHYRRKVGKD